MIHLHSKMLSEKSVNISWFSHIMNISITTNNKLCSLSELYRPSYRCLSANLVPTFADRGCCVVSTTNPYGRIIGFLDRSHYFFFQVAPQLYSRGWVYPIPDPLFLIKSGSTRNQTRDLWICSQELWPLDHKLLKLIAYTIQKSCVVIIMILIRVPSSVTYMK
jgi:hypothetical protein